MTLTQRLTRAGLVFVLLGTVAALIPTNGTANAATTCLSNGNTYTLGTSTGDMTTSYTFQASGGSVILDTFINGTPTPEVLTFTAATGSGTFTNSTSNSPVKITASGAASETVSTSFPSGGPTISVTVTAK